jgi:hypothetical protein
MSSPSLSSVLRGVNSGNPTTANQPALDELVRVRRRRALARKTPQQRRKLLQYQRRHNEKDERLYYCDYCDLFISSRHKTWMAHLSSARHLGAFRAYYDLASHVESVWVGEINRKVELARVQAIHRNQQQRAGCGAATPLAVQRIAPGIVVGGSAPRALSATTINTAQPQHVTTAAAASATPILSSPVLMLPSVQVGGAVVAPGGPMIRVGSKTVMPPPLPPRRGSAGVASTTSLDTHAAPPESGDAGPQ